MSDTAPYEIVEDRVVLRLDGAFALPEAVQAVTNAILFTREKQIRKLLVDASTITGFQSPSVSVRYFFVQEWANAAGGAVVVAMIARPEMIDPNKFGVLVATNRGLLSDVFVTEVDALAWLQAQG